MVSTTSMFMFALGVYLEGRRKQREEERLQEMAKNDIMFDDEMSDNHKGDKHTDSWMRGY